MRINMINTKNYQPVTAEEAVSIIKPGDKIFIHSAAAAPQTELYRGAAIEAATAVVAWLLK